MADLGLPRGGRANPPGGAPTYDFAKFSQKLHEIERIWTPGGGGASPKFYYVDLPLNIHTSAINAEPKSVVRHSLAELTFWNVSTAW